MTPASNGLGNALGEGLGLMVTSFLNRQDQLRQQEEQRAQLAADNAYRQQQVDAQAARDAENRRQFDESQSRLLARDQSDDAYRKWQEDQAAATDARNVRTDQIRGLSGPVSTFLKGLDDQIGQYAPTTNGKPNPLYNPAMTELLQGQKRKVMKTWVELGNTVASGEGWDQGRAAVMSLLGLQDGPDITPPSGPMQGPTAAPATPAPTPVAATMPAAPIASQVPAAPSGDFVGPSLPTTPQAAPADFQGPTQPTAPALPDRIQSIPASRLMDLPDDQILSTYGQGGLEYAIAARTEYTAKVNAQRELDVEANTKFWKGQFDELAKKDLTPTQRSAMYVIDQLNRTPAAELTPQQQQDYANAIVALAPAMYTAESWQNVLNTKDPSTVLGMLPTYQKYAPDVVAGFDPTEMRRRLDDDHNNSVADTLNKGADTDYKKAQTTDLNTFRPYKVQDYSDKHNESLVNQGEAWARTKRLQELLPLEKREYQDKHVESGARVEGLRADTVNTQQGTATAAFEMGVKTLAQLATTQAGSVSMYSLQHNGPDPKNPTAGSTWATLKSQLGVNDTALASMLAEGRYKYSLGVTGDELANQIKRSDLLTAGVNRANTIATMNMTLEEIKTEVATRQGRIDKLNAEIAATDASAANYRSLIAERDRLVDEKEQLTRAQTAAANASANNSNANAASTTALTPVRVARGWADIAAINQRLKVERERLAAYVQSVKGGYAVDMAQVQNIGARTALTRTQTPGDPMYRPEVEKAKAADPIGVIKSTADTKYYTPMRNALMAAQRYQTTVDGLVKQYTGASGSVNREGLLADPAYKNAVDGRDHAMKMAQDYRQKGDDYVTTSFGNLDRSTPGTHTGETQPSPFKTLQTTPGVTLTSVSPTLVSRMDTMLGGFKAPAGLVPIITQGTRTADEQAALYAKGRTVPGPNASKARPLGDIVTNAKPGESNHEDGDAVDISWMDPKTGKVLPGTDPRAQAAWKALGAQAPKFGLRWGGTFKTADGKPFVDMYHFEVAGSPQAATPRPTTPTPAKSSSPAPKPNAQLEAGLQAAIINGDGNAVNTYGGELVKAGYTQDQVLALIDGYKAKAGKK
ncbi:hypothetical protein HNQ07_004710 [Deinococcus metalli]|nr:M15 family metallopeptidase [Deinococcus metalli]MBB5379195.1 hypothetical protein [Deinococcus metalli]